MGKLYNKGSRERERSPEREAQIDAEAAELPEVSPLVRDAVVELLLEQRDTPTRRPEVMASILALVTELHRLKRPLATREAMARALGCSVHTIDMTLSSKEGEGLIALDIRTREGNVEQRASVVKDRFVVPSDDLLRAVAKGRAWERRTRD